MKRICMAAMVMLFVCVSAAFAHPPQDIVITYDAKTKVVSAVIYHAVSNPANHFIAKVDVALNDKEIITQTLREQDNGQTQTVSYRIPDAKPGDMVSVEAYCSISGALKKAITVSQ